MLRSWDLCFKSNGGGIFQVHLLILRLKIYVIGDWGGFHYWPGTIGPNQIGDQTILIAIQQPKYLGCIKSSNGDQDRFGHHQANLNN